MRSTKRKVVWRFVIRLLSHADVANMGFDVLGSLTCTGIFYDSPCRVFHRVTTYYLLD